MKNVADELWTEPIDGVAMGPSFVIPGVATVQRLCSDTEGPGITVDMATDDVLTIEQATDLAALITAATQAAPPPSFCERCRRCLEDPQ